MSHQVGLCQQIELRSHYERHAGRGGASSRGLIPGAHPARGDLVHSSPNVTHAVVHVRQLSLVQLSAAVLFGKR